MRGRHVGLRLCGAGVLRANAGSRCDRRMLTKSKNRHSWQPARGALQRDAAMLLDAASCLALPADPRWPDDDAVAVDEFDRNFRVAPDPDVMTDVSRFNFRREVLAASVAVAGTVVAVVVVLQLWRAHPRLPLYWSSDATSEAALAKNTLVNGWSWNNSRLGFPTGFNVQDHYVADTWHNVFWRVFSLGSRSWPLAVNVVYLGSFVLVAITGYIALRTLAVGRPIAAGGAIVYAFLPYHFFRNEMHLELSDYSAVPLLVALAVAQCSNRPWLRLRGGTRRCWWLAAVAVVVWLAGSGVYYALFGALLLVVSGLFASAVRRKSEPALSNVVLAGIVLCVLMLQLLPGILYDQQHGSNPAFARDFTESDHYSLRPLLLLAPIPQHRIDLLGRLSRRYDNAGLPSEGGQELGALPALGLLLLLGSAAAPLLGARGNRDPTDRTLAFLALVCIAVGVTGGGGTLIALLGFQHLRAWNRLITVIGFIAIAAGARALDRFVTRRRASSTIVIALVAALTVIAVADQTSAHDVPRYDAIGTSVAAERDFVHGIERSVGPHAAVLQLPYMEYPEVPPVVRMVDYSHLIGWLYSDTLRWSYGAVRGRANWQDGQVHLPLSAQLQRARAAGFTAVWVDRFGYQDNGIAIERALTTCLGPAIVVERDQRRVLFDLRSTPHC